MDSFTPIFVSHHQFQVVAGAEADDHLGINVVGDDLVHVTGRSQLTVLTGLHTGRVEVHMVALSAPPGGPIDGWDAATEATLWCPDSRITVCELMDGRGPDALRHTMPGGAGLYRVRVQARDRRPESCRPTPVPAPVERYQVSVWPVDEDTGTTTLRTDDLPAAGWRPDPARAAGWAMLRLIALANPDPRSEALRHRAERIRRAGPPDIPAVARVVVRRARRMPADRARQMLGHLGASLSARVDGDEGVLPAGEAEIRLSPVATPHGTAAEWRWVPRPGSAITVPDSQAGTVEIRARCDPDGGAADLVILHGGVRAQDAVLLGLIWEHLLDRAETVAADGGAPPLPWEPLFADLAAQAAARAASHHRARAEYEARLWGGTPPSDRLRGVPANTIGLSRLDRGLLDALAQAAPEVQRAMARWAARQACMIAGLAGIDWIVDALVALDHGDPLPAPFDDDHAAWLRLRTDRRVPTTTVTTAEGIENHSQQTLALPAIRAAAHANPLAGAVDTVYFAALAFGDGHRRLLAAALVELNRHG